MGIFFKNTKVVVYHVPHKQKGKKNDWPSVEAPACGGDQPSPAAQRYFMIFIL